jgi:hypothetical protein
LTAFAFESESESESDDDGEESDDEESEDEDDAADGVESRLVAALSCLRRLRGRGEAFLVPLLARGLFEGRVSGGLSSESEEEDELEEDDEEDDEVEDEAGRGTEVGGRARDVDGVGFESGEEGRSD